MLVIMFISLLVCAGQHATEQAGLGRLEAVQGECSGKRRASLQLFPDGLHNGIIALVDELEHHTLHAQIINLLVEESLGQQAL